MFRWERRERERGGIVEWLGRKWSCEKREFIYLFLSFSYRRSIIFFFFFFGFKVKSEFLLFIYLGNADMENCGEFKGFGYIYIYIHIKDLELFKNDRSDFILYEDFSIANKASLYIQVD